MPTPLSSTGVFVDNVNSTDSDVLDGINKPSIANSTNIPTDTRLNTDPKASSVKVEAVVDNKTIVDQIRQRLDKQKQFSSVLGKSYANPGSLAKADKRTLTSEESNAISSELRKLINSNREKSQKIKDAITVQQTYQPTVIPYSIKEQALLYQGMVRVFGHKDATITFEQYKAAIDARSKLNKDKSSSANVDSLKALNMIKL